MLGEGSLGDYAVASLNRAGRTVTATVTAGTLTLSGKSISTVLAPEVVSATLFLNGDEGSKFKVILEPGSLTLNGKDVTAEVIAAVEPGRLTLTGKSVSVVMPLHGGGSDRRKPKNYRTGFEPVRRLPPQKIEAKKTPVPLPPFRPAPRRVPKETAPSITVDRRELPSELLGLQDQIYVAQDLSEEIDDLNEILSADGDIGEIMMILESLD